MSGNVEPKTRPTAEEENAISVARARHRALAELPAAITPENLPESFDDRPHGRELL